MLGPSGSGKSTLLRAIAGLQRLDAGSVTLDGRSLAGVPPHRRGDRPHVPGRRAVPAPRRRRERRLRPADEGDVSVPPPTARVAELLALVGLAGREHRTIGSLSGGERKRVALARALAPAPRVLLLDEPLGALDRPLHDRLIAELRDLFDEIGQTALYVTHDVAEAFAVGAPRRGDARRCDRAGRDTRAALGGARRLVGGAIHRARERRRARRDVARDPARGGRLPRRCARATRSSSRPIATGRS